MLNCAKSVAKHAVSGNFYKIPYTLKVNMAKVRNSGNDPLRGKGVRVLDEEWDNLILLDACRADAFERHNTIKGEYSPCLSLGSSTKQWILRNFTKPCPEVAYVSANPMTEQWGLSKLVGSMKDSWMDSWDDKLKTVRAEEVVKDALAAKAANPSKRMVVHFIQPHAPYLGKTFLCPGRGGMVGCGEMWAGFRYGRSDLPLETLKKAYADNVKYVVKHAKKLVESLDGRTVITSDHGELFGEHGLYEHPYGLYVRELIEVPWHVVK